jgi:DHA2 family multidrug resistance protein-like MFS transporter
MIHKKWLAMAVISAALFLIGIDMTVLYTALPTLTHALNASNSEKLWVINAYPLAMAGLLLGLGTLGDRIGHRPVFMTGLFLFGLASFGAAFSPSVGYLIAGRALLAVGAAMMMPASLALIRQIFETDHERAIAIGVWGSVYSGAAAVGPLLGGLLLSKFWWGSVFLINVPVVIVALLLTPLLIKKTSGNPNRVWDLGGSLIVMVALVSLTYALKEVVKPTPDVLLAVISLLLGVVFMAWFVGRQNRSASPTVDFTLFRSAGFLGGVLAILVSMVAFMGVQLILTQRLQLVLGLTPLQSGLFMLPMSLASFLTGPLIGSKLLRLGVERALWIALLIGATGLAGLAYFEHGTFTLQITSLFVFGFGAGATASISSTAIMINTPEEKAGMAASIEGVSFEIGGAIGVALMGSIATYLYSSSINLPTGLLDGERARDSLDQAIILAGHLNANVAKQLIVNADSAYDTAYLGVVLTGAAIMAALGIMYARFLKPTSTRSADTRRH